MKANKDKILAKLKTARGQLDGIMRMVEDDRYCIDISTQLMSTLSILKNVNKEILQAHIRGCVREALESNETNPKLEEALSVLEKMTEL